MILMNDAEFDKIMEEGFDESCPICGCEESGWEYHDCYGTSADESYEWEDEGE